MGKVLILTEAGRGIGFGHYTRCSAINKAANDKGISSKMMVNVKGNNFTLDELIGAFNWLDNIDEIVKSPVFEIVIIDSYLLNLQGYEKIKAAFKKTIVIDDYNRINYAADVLINPNVYFDTVDYSNQKAKCYGGEKYVILREVFRNADKYYPCENISNILITLGGSDVHDLLPVINKIITEHFDAAVTVVSVENIQREQLKRQFPEVSVLGALNSDEVFSIFQSSDIIVSGCGQTLHELAALGKPVVGVCVGDDQLLNQAFYLQREFLLKNIQHNQSNISDVIVAAVNELYDIKVREQIFKKSEAIFNRNGVFAIFDLLNL